MDRDPDRPNDASQDPTRGTRGLVPGSWADFQRARSAFLDRLARDSEVSRLEAAWRAPAREPGA